ncbi:MAG: hypothetical protein KGY76_02010 [Candidatus Thermoplasmatota archaeon]|nr:hypothetical protein [Candidatus Thermoplasmatota archaeon]
MHKYVALIDGNYWDTMNGLWAVIKKDMFTPDMIYLLAEENDEEMVNALTEDCKSLLDQYGIESEIQSQILDNGLEEVEKLIQEDSKAALDISGGTKHLTARVLANISTSSFDHIFCLSIDKNIDPKRPLPTIDMKKTVLEDLKGKPKGDR